MEVGSYVSSNGLTGEGWGREAVEGVMVEARGRWAGGRC